MARILFAWEFGVNAGHLAQLLPLAARLRARGHDPVFAMSDVVRAEAVLGQRGFEYLQAPVWRARSPRPMVIPCSYSELLQHYGYLDPDGLLGLAKAWREIYRLVEPQVILFEHALASLLELFDVDDDFLCTFAELDHYAARPNAHYCGPMYAGEEGAQAAWPERGGKRVYVSLRPEMRAFHPVAEALSDSGHSVLWSAPRVSDEFVRRYEKGTLKFVREPVRLADATRVSDAAVLPGGHGAVSAMLLAGVPIALYPARVEHLLVTRNVAEFGAGLMASPRATVSELASPLTAVLENAAYKERASAFAAKYSDHDPKSVVARIGRRIGAYCEQRSAAS